MLSQIIHRIRRTLHSRKLFLGIQTIAMAPIDELRDPSKVAMLIRSVGLHFDLRGSYGSDNAFMNWKGEGLWQIPAQLAGCLVELSKHKIHSFIEIGTSKGWTSTFITAYLLRFNPDLKTVTVDPVPQFTLYPRVSRQLPLEYAAGKTSEDFRQRPFDLAFIDGDHSYPWLVKDYENVGKNARIVMFHDINDNFVSSKTENEGGVRRFWQELRQSEAETAAFHEFLDHTDDANFMGVGLRVRR